MAQSETADKRLIVAPKPQPTLKGYTAWAFNQLMRRKRLGRAEIAAWIIDRWIDEDSEGYLAKRGITFEALEEELASMPTVLKYSPKD